MLSDQRQMEMCESEMTILNDIINICNKEIKEETDAITQIVLGIFSAWTDNPQNNRILAPSGEGKTYLVTKISRLFPQENVIVLAKATPQSLKYTMSSKRVVENGPGNWQDYDVTIKPLEEESAKTKNKEKNEELQKQIRELRDSACDLVDFSHKVIILVDSQSFELFESLKPTLSHDQKEIKSFSVNKSKSGTMKGQKFLFRGFPALIYCSAKDEQQKDKTDEINTRFNTISLTASSKKYRQMLELEAIKASLPDAIYQEEVISEEEIESIKDKIENILIEISSFGEIVNPYGLEIQKQFRDDAGYRTRQLKILNNNITIHTLIDAKSKPKIVYDEITTPIATRIDVEAACNLTKESKEIPSSKIKFYNDYIRPTILEFGKTKGLLEEKCLTASEIVDYIANKGLVTDRQKIQETFLRPLSDHGFLDEYDDPENRSRYVYSVVAAYVDKKASLESTLIDASTLDVSCLDSYVNKFIEHRFNKRTLKILDEKDNEINPKELLILLHQIDAETPKISHKKGSVETSTSIDDFGDKL